MRRPRHSSRISRSRRYYHYDPLPDIAEHFRKNNATSRENAIEMNQLDWASLGLKTEPTKSYTFIKQDGNKYWIDLQELEEFSSRVTERSGRFFRFFKVFLIIIAVFVVICFCIISIFALLWLIGGVGTGSFIYKIFSNM